MRTVKIVDVVMHNKCGTDEINVNKCAGVQLVTFQLHRGQENVCDAEGPKKRAKLKMLYIF